MVNFQPVAYPDRKRPRAILDFVEFVMVEWDETFDFFIPRVVPIYRMDGKEHSGNPRHTNQRRSREDDLDHESPSRPTSCFSASASIAASSLSDSSCVAIFCNSAALSVCFL